MPGKLISRKNILAGRFYVFFHGFIVGINGECAIYDDGIFVLRFVKHDPPADPSDTRPSGLL